MPPLPHLDATAQADAVRRGDVTASELLDAAIGRVDACDPALGAFAHTRFERAHAETPEVDRRAPFAGVPFAAKDIGGESAGDPLHAGSAWLRRVRCRATQDSYFVRRMRAAGFVLVGRTKTPEFGLGITTEPLAHGPTRNPWSLEHSAGGSSGGSGAAVAAGLVPVAHGNDGGGSLRIPASCCGAIGLKPTRGRVSLGPTGGHEWGGLVVDGVIVSSLRDLAGVLDVIAGPMPGDPSVAPIPPKSFTTLLSSAPAPLRVGVLTGRPDGRPCHPSCAAAAVAAATTLQGLGHSVAEGHPAALAEDVGPAIMRVVESSVAHEIDVLSEHFGPPQEGDLEPATADLVERGRRLSAVELNAALAEFNGFSRRLTSWWDPLDGSDGFDVLVTPTLPEPPARLGALRVPFGEVLDATPFTPAANVAGLPAISVPWHEPCEPLPIGIQLMARFGREHDLLQLAAQLEREGPARRVATPAAL